MVRGAEATARLRIHPCRACDELSARRHASCCAPLPAVQEACAASCGQRAMDELSGCAHQSEAPEQHGEGRGCSAAFLLSYRTPQPCWGRRAPRLPAPPPVPHPSTP